MGKGVGKAPSGRLEDLRDHFAPILSLFTNFQKVVPAPGSPDM